MTTELQTERHGTTLVLRLNGPATRNALSPQVYAAGVETLNMAEANPDVHAVVLTGANGHFCGGGDLQRLVDGLFYDRRAIDRLDLIVQAEILDLAPDLMEIVNLLPPGYYDRQSLCDQLNSALAAHGWGAVYGTVE